MDYFYYFFYYYKKNMKCIKALKTNGKFKVGDIIRVDNQKASNLVGEFWEYTSKSEWKKISKTPKKKSSKKVK